MKNKAALFLTLMLGLFLIAGCGKTASPEKSDDAAYEPPQKLLPPNGGEVKEFDVIAKQWDFVPSTITVGKGDTVKLSVKSIDVTHGFALPEFGINERLEPNKEVVVEFVAGKSGTFPFYCSVPCGSGHGGMRGELVVK